MKRLQIKKDQLEMLAGLYDGISLFYDNEREEALMLQDVLDSDLSQMKFDRDATVIVKVTERLEKVLELLSEFTLNNDVHLPRTLTQSLRSDEVKIFRLLGVGNHLMTASYVESYNEPEEKFLLINISHAHSEENCDSKFEASLKVFKTLEGEVYFHQQGGKCQKKSAKLIGKSS